MITNTERSSLSKKGRILNALIIRELMHRFGHSNIGFLWVVCEPLLLTVGVMVLWSIIYGELNHGVKVLPLVLTGYTMLTLWRHMIARFTHCFRQNAGLYFHRYIRPFDTVVARAVIEIVATLIAFYIAYIPLVLMEFITPIHDHLLLLGAWFGMSAFTFGFALIIGCLTELSDSIERMVQPVMYLMLPLSGAFYMVSWLPIEAQKIVLLAPMVHASEMFRAGYFGPGVETHWDFQYLLFCSLIINALALSMVGKAQNKIEFE